MIENSQGKPTQLCVIKAGDNRHLDAALICPRCRENYLHHGAVVVYHRGREDADETLLTVCDGERVSKQRYPSGWLNNPSRRRDGLAIQFDCEFCGDGIELTIEQHKGQTFLHWRVGPSSYTPGEVAAE
jgi:hypothetical protein